MNATKKELLSVRIPKWLNEKLTDHVTKLGITKTAFILVLINKELFETRYTEEKK